MNPEQLIARIEHQKELHKNANSRKGQRPHRKTSRFELEILFRPGQKEATDYSLIQTVIGYAYPPCTAPLVSLKPMLVHELLLETHHRGRLLVVRAFGFPIRVQAVQNAVEDSEGGVERLSVYNFHSSLEAEQVLQKGGIYAIKEPYYKVTGDGGSGIRVDHPSDIVRLRSDDPNVPVALRPRVVEIASPTAAQLKVKGNAAYKRKAFQDAVDYYSHALQICAGSDFTLAADLHRNRALVNLNLERYEAALLDAEAAVIDSGSMASNVPNYNGKAHYRSGCAAYHLMDFDRAKLSFEKVLQIAPDDTDAQRELRRTGQRLVESAGQYEFETMGASVNEQHRRLDHASYTSNVEVRQTADRGRGLFATRAMKAGELVICEKALVVAFDNEEVGKHSVGKKLRVIMNLNDNTIDLGTHATRLTLVINKLLHSPKQASRFLDLHGAGYESKENVHVTEEDVVALDTFQVQSILQRNGFGLDLDEDEKHTGGSTGAWILASYANHDCLGNVSRAFIGDMMIVRAFRDIKKDEEITMRYLNVDERGFQDFQDRLQQAWRFQCDCKLCQVERKVQPVHQQRRQEIMREVKALLDNPVNQLSDANPPSRGTISEAQKLYAKLVNTYDDTLFKKLPRPALNMLSLWLCMAYAMESTNKLLDMALQVLRNLGIMVTISKPQKQKVSIDHTHARLDVSAIHAAMYAGTVLEHQGRNSVAKQMKEYGRELYRGMKGSLHGFEEVFGKF